MKICLNCRRKLFDYDTKCDKCKCVDLMDFNLFKKLYDQYKTKSEIDKTKFVNDDEYFIFCKYVFPTVKKPSILERQKQSTDDKLKLKNENEKFIKETRQNSKHHSKLQSIKNLNVGTNQVSCPKCGSSQIQIVTRKWSLLTGFLTNKVDRVCVNCKHRF